MTMARRSPKALYVVCISNRGYQASLVSRRIYQSLPDPEAAKRNLIRVVDETGEDYLYPEKFFRVLDLPRSVESAVRRAAG